MAMQLGTIVVFTVSGLTLIALRHVVALLPRMPLEVIPALIDNPAPSP